MFKFHLKFTALLTALTLLFTLSTPVFADTTNTSSSITKEEANSYFDQAVNLIMSRYKFDTSREGIYEDTIRKLIEKDPEVIYDILRAMFGSLDDYSTYYSEEELESFVSNTSGEFCGIGVVIMTVDEGLFVTNVYDNTPAKEVGLMVGDIIIRVGDISLAGMDISVAQSKILGEENTPVNLTVLRNGQTFEINPIRRKVVIESGFFQAIENDTIGYISITDFNPPSVELTEKALDAFDEKGITKIIIDLRNNPGGDLSSFIKIASMFVPKGPAINFEYKNPFNNFSLDSYNDDVKYALAVLVNENSASASEAFAAAVKDSGVGAIIGVNTFGKGTMQNITRFSIGGGVKLTEAEFLSPLGNKINKVGVQPNIKAEDKLVDYHRAGYEKTTYERVIKLGDTGNDVYAVEQRLYALGFDIGLPDKYFDEKSHNAVLRFQKSTELYPYGVADITTQLKIEEVLSGTKVYTNNTIKRAVDFFKYDNWKNIIKFDFDKN